MKKVCRAQSLSLMFFFITGVFCASAWAQYTGLVDDYEGNYDPEFAGSYVTYGQNTYSAENATQSKSPTHSRYLWQYPQGSATWGIGTEKQFSPAADASVYQDGTLDVWVYSATDHGIITFDVEFEFNVGGEISAYSIKAAQEPTLSSLYGQWTKVSVPLTESDLERSDWGYFDLSCLTKIKFLLRFNGQTPPAGLTVYFDDVRFVESGDTVSPEITFTEPDVADKVFATDQPTFTGLLSDDDSGIDPASLTLSIDGIIQSDPFALPDSFSCTADSPLTEGHTHTVTVQVADMADNTQSAQTTFSIDTSLDVDPQLLNPGFEYGDGTNAANWIKWGLSGQSDADPGNGARHVEAAGNNSTATNYTGFYQILEAEPGQTWQAGVYAQAAEQLAAGCYARLQMVFVDAGGNTVPGGENNSGVILDDSSSVGTYTELTVEGTAPAGTEGVKIVLLYAQVNDGAGKVYFDDASLEDITPDFVQIDGMVDDFDGGADVIFLGSYAAFGDSELEGTATGLTSEQAHDSTWSRYLEMTESNAASWGVVAQKMLDETADASAYYGGTLEVWYYSTSDDPELTFDVNLVFEVADGDNTQSVYTLKAALEPALADAHNQWTLLSVPILYSSFDMEDYGAFDMSAVKAVELLIHHDGVGPNPAAKVYFDDVRFVETTDAAPPTVIYTHPASDGAVYAAARPTIAGLLSDDESGVDIDSLTLSIDGVEQTNVLVLPESFSCRADSVLAEGVVHTAVVQVADMVGNAQAAPVTFTVDLSAEPRSELYNGDMEYGDGTRVASWDKFGEVYQVTDEPYSGDYHIKLVGNYDSNAHYSGVFQVLPAEPGQTWRASAYAQVSEAFGAGCTARVQLIYLRGDGTTAWGGTYNSEGQLDHTSTVGVYTQLVAEGRAPVDTEAVKIVLLLTQHDDADGIVSFDAAELVETTMISDALPANALVDDFDDEAQYRGQENDLGFYTDDDALFAEETVSNGVLKATWTSNAYWYTLFSATNASASLQENQYLALRCRGHAGGEHFLIKLTEPAEPENFSAVVTNEPITDTEMHTVNYPLSLFADQGLNMDSIRTLSLEFSSNALGTISIDGIALTTCRRPDTIDVSAPALVDPGVPFDLTLTVSDQDGVIEDYDGTLHLDLSDGTVIPDTVSGFENGSVTVSVTVDAPVYSTLTAEDMLGAQGIVDLELTAAPAVPQNLLSSASGSGIELTWEPQAGSDGYHVYRRDDELDPEPADLMATVTGEMADQYTDTVLQSDHPYIYRVASYNQYGESDCSGPAMGTRYTLDWSPAPQTHGGLECLSRVVDGRLLLHTEAGDMPFVAGVNIGASTPGYSPGAVNISREEYQRWFSQIAGLGFRLIRIYTLHKPPFYEELRNYNLANPDAPIYLQHGVWLIEEHRFVQTGDLFDPIVMQSFRDEIDDVISAVHGDLVRTQMPGRAYGTYTADISPWLMNYIVGIEMEPHAVDDSDDYNAWRPAYNGTYFQSAPDASPTEKWFAEMFDYTAANLASRGVCVPLAHGNWPTTDPLEHPDEPIAEEDLVGVDVNHVVPTAAWPAGRFANYHIYPYYPDAVRFEDGITNFVYKGQIDNYAGYINKIVQHHAIEDVPVVISEYGVPSSMGNAHYGPLGRDQGGHSEQQQMQIDRDLLGILRNVGCSGASVFMWLDEWFKTTWNVMDLHLPTDRRWFWRNPWCNEANFGIVAAEAGPRQRIVIDGDDSEWTDQESELIYSGAGDVQEVRATHDEGYLYLRVKTAASDVWLGDRLLVGFDVLDAGNQGLPGCPGLGADAEYAIEFTSTQGMPKAQAYLAKWNDFLTIVYGLNRTPPYFDVNMDDMVEGSGAWTQQLLIVSRRLTNTVHQIMPEYFNVGDMRFGTTDPQDPDFDQRTTWSASGNVIEVRVPYTQIGYSDPSSHKAYRIQLDGSNKLVNASEVGISLVYDNQEFTTDGYAWEDWNDVQWHERLKADIDVFAQAVIDVHHNHEPVIQEIPEATVTGGGNFSFTVNASDANALEWLSYALLQAPDGMTINDRTGDIAWQTTAADNGIHTVEVMVEDALGAMDTQSFTLNVTSLDNPGLETGSGTTVDGWNGFGERYHLTVAPHTGSGHVKLQGNYTGAPNYSGIWQIQPAQPGQTWKARAYAAVAEPLAEGCKARLELKYVDADQLEIPGAVFASDVELDHNTPVGEYIALEAQGYAPEHTEGVKVVLVYIQDNDGDGAVYFDDVNLWEITTRGQPLTANVTVDDFDSPDQYDPQHRNDLGQYTHDDGSLETHGVANGIMTAGWTDGGYWYTVFNDVEPYADLGSNQYLVLRYQGLAGGETFDLKLAGVAGTGATIGARPITDSDMHTVNYPLADFAALGLNLHAVKSLALEFPWNAPGTITVDGIALATCPQPDQITVDAPAVVDPNEPFDVVITVADQDGSPLAGFDGSLALSVSDGTVTPQAVSGFENGIATVAVTVADAMFPTLYARDLVDTQGSAELEVATAPDVPMALLSGPAVDGILLGWQTTEGADGYRIYRRDDELDPDAGDLVATVNGQAADTYTDTSAITEHPYFYRVTAFNTYGESALSEPAMGTRFSRSWAPAPDTVNGLSRIARVENGRMWLQTQAGDQPFVAGVNIGATVPGYSPGALNISAEQYRKWFARIAGVGFRSIRIYTLHPPEFYQELRAYNLANPDAPLYLQHGVWLIEEEHFLQTRNLYDSVVVDSFKNEISDVIAAVNGDLVRDPMPGRADGVFDADVSPWLMCYIIGIEMDPNAVLASDNANASQPDYTGTYFESAPAASPTEKWYAEMFDHTATEMAAYGSMAPLAHGNWPTTDPLNHPDEPIPDEDKVGVDVNHVLPTVAWPAGRFANYHAYPYYPDAVRFEDGITNFVYKGRMDNYAGYINKLVQHHATAGVPVVISEFGVPSSMGNAHYGPLGRDQGGHSEQQQMQIDRDLLDILRNVGCSGGSVFMWVDEWFKTTWNVKDLHKPNGRRWFWRNPWCNEANFGLVAAEAGPRRRIVIDGDDSEWNDQESQVIYSGAGDVQEVRATHDEGYVYLRIKTADPDAWMSRDMLVGFDVLAAGNQGLPGNPGLDTDAEYALKLGHSGSAPQGQAYLATWNDLLSIHYGTVVSPPYFPVDPAAVVEGSGSWTQQQLIVSRRLTVPTTGEQMPPEYYNVGDLRFGTTDPQDPDFDQRTAWSADGDVIEVRVPYMQIGYGDPSSHQAYRVQADGSVTLVDAPDVGITLVFDGQEFETAGYQWAAWNQVQWHERLKADIDVFAQAVVDVHHNVAPVIGSTPAETVYAGDTYTYSVTASDANALERLSYALLQGPSGMTVDENSGLVSWDTDAADVGGHTVEVQVRDGLDAVDSQSYTLVVFDESSDYDGDALPDAWEVQHGFDPVDEDNSAGDPDGDGVLNADEYLNGLDPNAEDTDQDGVDDGDEPVNLAAQPNSYYDSVELVASFSDPVTLKAYLDDESIVGIVEDGASSWDGRSFCLQEEMGVHVHKLDDAPGRQFEVADMNDNGMLVGKDLADDIIMYDINTEQGHVFGSDEVDIPYAINNDNNVAGACGEHACWSFEPEAGGAREIHYRSHVGFFGFPIEYSIMLGLNSTGQMIGLNLQDSWTEYRMINGIPTPIHHPSRMYGWIRQVETEIGGQPAVIYNNLGHLGGENCYPADLNDDGTVVGAGETDTGDLHAFLYRGGPITDLGTLGGAESWATEINAFDQIIGWSMDATETQVPFLHEQGLLRALQDCLTVALPGTIEDFRLNSDGRLVAVVDNGSGSYDLYRLKPIDEDGDGMGNVLELLVGRNPLVPDDPSGPGGGETSFAALSLMGNNELALAPGDFMQFDTDRRYTKLTGGASFSVAVDEDGRAWAWGRYTYGQLGNPGYIGDTNFTGGFLEDQQYSQPLPVPVVLPGDPVVVEVSARHNHALALDDQGRVYTWGANHYGDLGIGACGDGQPDVHTPMQLTTLPEMKTISAGYFHNMGLATNGRVWTWGSGWQGQLGAGYLGCGLMPMELNLDNITRIAAGCRHAMALSEDGTVWTWGWNKYGQIGNDDTNNVYYPVQVPGLSNVVEIKAANYNSYALLEDGTIRSWGANEHGQLGNGSADFYSAVPVQVTGLSQVLTFECGNHTALALTEQGQLWTWGTGGNGQLGDNYWDDAFTPVPVQGVEDLNLTPDAYMQFGGGGAHMLLTTADGDLYSWGCNHFAELGYLSPENTHRQPVTFVRFNVKGNPPDSDGDGITDQDELWQNLDPDNPDTDGDGLVDGDELTAGTDPLVFDSDGDVLSDGYEITVLGTDPLDEADGPQNFTDRKRLAGASSHSVAIRQDGTVWCWGRYTVGELGDGRIGDPYYTGGWPPTDQEYSQGAPVQAQMPGNPVIVEVSARHSHSLALDDQGHVYGWGANYWGDLGVGNCGGSSNSDARTPFVYTNMPAMKSVSAGYYHNLGLTPDGDVWAWGSGWEGQLGAGHLGGGLTPFEIDLDGIVDLSAGCRHSMALRGDGTVWTWGWNKYGQVGNDDTNDVYYPVQVQGLGDVVDIVACNYDSMALKADGTVWMWGCNEQGQLGNGTTDPSGVPVQVPGLSNVVRIGAGYHTPMAMTADGQVYTWGAGGNGQLGDNYWDDSLTPIPIQGLVDLGLIPDQDVEFGGGGWHSMLMTGNGYVYTWGCNHYGQVGYLTPWNTHRTPVTFMGLNMLGPNPDTDADGLIDIDERQWGTDPEDADSDDDGVSDGDEVLAGTDPLDPMDY